MKVISRAVRGDAAVEVGFSIVLRAHSLVGPKSRKHPELRAGSAGENVARFRRRRDVRVVEGARLETCSAAAMLD